MGTEHDAEASGAIDAAEVLEALPGDLALLVYLSALPDPHGDFRQACGAGDLPLARALAGGLEAVGCPAAARRENAQRALEAACRGGHLAVVQWLAGRRGPHRSPASGRKSARRVPMAFSALEAACEAGHLAVAEWVAGRFALGAAAPSGSVMAASALRAACRRGHLGVARWLADNFRLGADDVLYFDQLILQTALAGGDVEIARWFVRRFAVGRPVAHGAARSVFGRTPEGVTLARRALDAIYGPA